MFSLYFRKESNFFVNNGFNKQIQINEKICLIEITEMSKYKKILQTLQYKKALN